MIIPLTWYLANEEGQCSMRRVIYFATFLSFFLLFPDLSIEKSDKKNAVLECLLRKFQISFLKWTLKVSSCGNTSR